MCCHLLESISCAIRSYRCLDLISQTFAGGKDCQRAESGDLVHNQRAMEFCRRSGSHLRAHWLLQFVTHFDSGNSLASRSQFPGGIDRFPQTPSSFLSPRLLCQVVLIQGSANEDFDYGLAADVQVRCGSVQFLQHVRRKIHVDSLDWLHHPAAIGKMPRYIASLFCHLGYGFGRQDLFPTRFLHKACFPVALRATTLPGDSIHRCDLHGFRR